jgi:hypothetical protein
MSKHDELVERLKRALAEDDGDESWADDLPEADDLPDDEDDTVAEIGPKRPLDASSRPLRTERVPQNVRAMGSRVDASAPSPPERHFERVTTAARFKNRPNSR